MSIEYDLFSKHTLKFNEDGHFKILMMSDIQEPLNYDPRTLDCMDRLIEKERPDFVMLGGDNCNGLVMHTPDELKAYLDIFSVPMEKRKIPWAHVFGNHDHDMKFDDLTKTKIYEQYPYCVSKHTDGMKGTTNYVLPIYTSSEDRIAFHLWALDSNNSIKDTFKELDFKRDIRPLKRTPVAAPSDIVGFEQLMWYWNTSKKLEEHNGALVNGLLFMHVAPWEFLYIMENPEQTGGVGSMVENMGLGTFNSGLFSTILQRGDIKCIACGHTHKNDFVGTFCGVKMCLDACAGYSPYGIDELRGGRVFILNENDPADIQTYMSAYQNLT